MNKQQNDRKRKLLDWLKKTEPYTKEQPLMVFDYVIQALDKYCDDPEISEVLTRIKLIIRDRIEIKKL